MGKRRMGVRWTLIYRGEEAQKIRIDFAWRLAFVKADNCIDIGAVFY
jgi:hypothetical protein